MSVPQLCNTINSIKAVTVEISAFGAEELDKVRQSWNNHPVSIRKKRFTAY